jgi:thymidylate synthase ThyX
MASPLSFAPLFERDRYTSEDARRLAPFFTNLDQSVYAPLIGSPEVIGALCSRASRASDDLRAVFLREYMTPFLNPVREEKDTDASWAEKRAYGSELETLIAFLHEHPIEKIFSNPRARSFYHTWLAQYGDDSIAQMAGMHLVFSSLSQVAIKHFEDQRIGLAPIEKSTRYVNYAAKVHGQYRYYTDPTLADLGLASDYRAAMDGLFETYATLLPRLRGWLAERFPGEKPAVIEKKAFDTLRGLLPVATLSQVAFFGNGQAFEYLVSRSGKHPLGEVRWAADRAYEELSKIGPAFLRRLKDPEKQSVVETYQDYLAGKGKRMRPLAEELLGARPTTADSARVRLVEADPDGELNVLAAMLYASADTHRSWEDTLRTVRVLGAEEKRRLLDAYLAGRTERWQKVGRAFEHAYVRFEITMNIGAWRDLHRHRMLTQERQTFSCVHGYDVPPEVDDAGLGDAFRSAVDRAEAVWVRIRAHDPLLAQYAVTLAHRVRFLQWTNLRECFWEIELRTIPEGHPDYRKIEQEKFLLLQKAYPLIAERMRVNMGQYDFARRGQEERIQAKLRELSVVQQP